MRRVTITIDTETLAIKEEVRRVLTEFLYEMKHGLTLVAGDDFGIGNALTTGRLTVSEDTE